MDLQTNYTNSKIIQKQTEFIVPTWVLDDVGYFYPLIYDKILSESKDSVIFPINFYDAFTQLRKQIYWLCNWYDELVEANIPVIEAEISCIHNDPQMMDQILKQKLTEDKIFIRFCNASPKDIIDPFFNSTSDVVSIFKSSNRTNYMFDNAYHHLHETHLVLRPIVKMDYEVRCIWHNRKLRAVSCPTFIDTLTQLDITNVIDVFFQTHGENIIFNSVVIDLGITDMNAFIIELNSFGSDMLAKIAYFDWEEDFNVLYNASTVIYRFKKEFEW